MQCRRILIPTKLFPGVKFFDKCEVQRVLTKNNQVRGVVTAKRMVECKYFVNCAGMVNIGNEMFEEKTPSHKNTIMFLRLSYSHNMSQLHVFIKKTELYLLEHQQHC